MLKELVKQGLTQKQIAKQLGVSERTVRRRLKKAGLKTVFANSKYISGDTHKQCSRCNSNKTINQFYTTSYNTPASECIQCANNYRHRRKLEAANYLGGKCQICAYDKCIEALDFHHISPKEKEFNISDARGMSMKKLKPELDKCILVCSNCHREIHAGLHEPKYKK